jgi:CRP-like cAMP-binding protein
VIFARGDAATGMYVVAEGEIDLAIGDQHLETLGKAGIFGELSIITKEPRSGTATARTDCRLIEISEQRFIYMVQETPNFALEVMRVLVARLRRRDPVA